MAPEKRLIEIRKRVKFAGDVHQELLKAGWDLETATRLVNSIPDVDAVEVVEYDAIVNKLECLLCHATGGKYSKAGYSWETMERMVTDYIEECCEEAVAEGVVRCKDCAVPHNRWTGCPKLNGLIPPPDFYCAYGERRTDNG